ncbi:SPOC like C-terminal domain-containing protein [Gongronella butleri]|nr:SPOC like C-terminal domain-containing protein [Gongronella butleri]
MAYSATVYVVNCGHSMTITPHGASKTAFEQAVDVIVDGLSAKVLADRKTELASVILAGTQETKNKLAEPGQYQNITEHCGLAKAQFESMRRLLEVRPADATDPAADLLSALILAIDQIQSVVGKKKYTKQIMLITDGTAPIDWQDLPDVQQAMLDSNINLIVLGTDFGPDGADPCDDVNTKEIMDTNAAMWNELSNAISERPVMRLQDAHDQSMGFKVKQVKPTPVFRQHLYFGSEGKLQLNVHMYTYTSAVRPLALKKWSTLSDIMVDNNAASSSTADALKLSHSVNTVRRKRVKKLDQPGNEGAAAAADAMGGLDDDNLAMETAEDSAFLNNDEENVLERAYPFGNALVMITAEQEAFLQLETTPGLWILGFYPVDKIPRHYYLDRVYLILPGPMVPDESGPGLDALSLSMSVNEVVALVRYVSKAGANPKLGVVSPCTEFGVNLLQFCQLPFDEDMREFMFNSLDKVSMQSGNVITQDHPLLPTKEMNDTMARFVKGMDLCPPNAPELYVPEENFNPAVWRVNQAINARALNPSAPLPELHPRLVQQTRPPDHLVRENADLIQSMAALFNCKQVESDKKRVRYGAPGDLSNMPPGALGDDTTNAPAGGPSAGNDGDSEAKRFKTEESSWDLLL